MRFVDAAEIRRVLSFPGLVQAMAEAHRRPRMPVKDVLIDDAAGSYFVRSAVDPGRFMLSKLVTSFPGNPAAGRPTVQAVAVLFDAQDGRPLLSLDGTELTHWRTAADSALGASLLAAPSPNTLLLVGAGAMARPLVRAHRAVRPSLARVLVWNRSRDRAEAVVRDLVAEGMAAELAPDLREATRQADVITACTAATEPLIRGADLKPGVHVDLIGGYTPAMREADDDAIRRARVYTDRRESAADVGDITQPLASGALAPADLLADLYDLCAAPPPGRAPDAITLFKNAGGGHLDLMTAEAVLRGLDGAAA